MDYPEWVTPANLGTFSQDYSFEVNPLIIYYGAGAGSVIRQINGELPNGLRLETSANTVRILGACVQTSSDINARFTLRITQTNGNIADRTFFIILTEVNQPPSWDNQDTFLGYQNNTLPQSYQLIATAPAGQYITYNIQSVSVTPPIAVSTSINQTTGLLVCDAANVVINNTIIDLTVRATTSLYSDINCSIEVITVPGAPKWMTPAGSLGTYAGDDFIEINLIAEDLDNGLVTYNMVSNPSGVPLTVASDGLLYGRLPNVITEEIYTFTVGATNINGTSTRSFTIITVPNESLSLLQWVTDSNLGFINEGGYYSIPIKATTKRNTTIVYNLTGGTLPPNMLISKTDGSLDGFCEYHAIPKYYSFNVSATDGYQTITKQFNLQIKKLYGDVFFGVSIPLMGSERNSWLVDAGNVRVREPGKKVFNNFETIENPPTLNVIKGVLTDYANANDIYNELSPWLHQLDLQIGQAANTAITSDNTLVYRLIDDYQSGANLSVYSNSVYNTNVQTNGIVTPISIENIRQTLTTNRQFANSGSGNGLVITPVLDWSTGSISSINVINPGSGYVYPPTIKVLGSGDGASLRAVLGLVSFSILDGGIDWNVGDVVEVKIGLSTDYARFTVTQVGNIGDIINVTIDYAGDYLQIPLAESITLSKNTISTVRLDLNWGVTAVEVINGGSNYQNSISFDSTGSEILPWWQSSYQPAISVGNINGISGSGATTILNYQTNLLYGAHWQPNYTVFYWEGLRWIGSSTFDEDMTSFDGDLTRFEEAQSAYETVFDGQLTYFDESYTIFDYIDPLEYDQATVWGQTIFSDLLTIFEYYATVFDRAIPKKTSNTVFNKLIRVNNKVYSGNNAVW